MIKSHLKGKTTICAGDSISLHANAGVKNVRWTTVSDPSTIISTGPFLKHKPLNTTAYRVIAEGCDKQIIDTVTVSVIPLPKVNLGGDTTICTGTEIELDAGEHYKYSWQDNSTRGVIIIGIQSRRRGGKGLKIYLSP